MKVVRANNSFRLRGDGKFVVRANDFFEILDVRAMSPHTARAYAFDLLALFRWLKAKEKPWTKAFSQKDLQTWMIDCQRQKLMPRTINRRLACARAFYRFCFGDHMPHAAGVLYPKGHYKGPRRDRRLGLFFARRRHLSELKIKIPRTAVDPLKPSEIDGFLVGIRRYRDLSIVLTMLLCGLRSQEVINLRLQDVDFHQSQVKVRGKGRKERIVPLPYRLMQVFERYLVTERPQTEQEPFFVILQGDKSGQSMTPAGLRSLFRYRSKIADLPRARPHQFRHAFAADMARAGVPLTTIQRLLGHSDPATSEKYIELFLDDIRADYELAMKKIETRYAALQS